jgi:magnesium transporter
VALDKNLQEELILRISDYQELTMMLRENIIDKQRVLSALLRSDFLPRDCDDRLRIILKDIASLLSYTEFSFERLEYLQNTFLGLLGLEQNKVIKIFTVATVIFMPPTLIASLYGMNFHFMPELEWEFGYAFALFLMLGSSAATLLYFKGRKWL